MTDDLMLEARRLAVAVLTAWDAGGHETIDALVPTIREWNNGVSNTDSLVRRTHLMAAQAQLASWLAHQLAAATGESVESIYQRAGHLSADG